MRLTFEPLGKYVRLVDERNTDMVSESVLGINIDKYFMPSVANVIGTDLSSYKLLRNGRFACNPMHVGRDGRLPVARYTGETPAIVSPAYFMFEIKDENAIEPEYLMLCFRRPDFDRMCWFRTDASVRGGITWDDVCALTIPVPPIAEQRRIVRDYQVITERIELLEQLNGNLSAILQTLFNKIFCDAGVNLSETITKGTPIPDDWILSAVGKYASLKTGPFGTQLHSDEYVLEGTPIINVKNIGQGSIIANSLDYLNAETCARLSAHRLKYGDIVFGRKGSVDHHAFISKEYEGWMQGSDCIRVRPKDKKLGYYLHLWFSQPVIKQLVVSSAIGSTMASLNTRILGTIPLLIPPEGVLSSFLESANKIIRLKSEQLAEIKVLSDLTVYFLWNINSLKSYECYKCQPSFSRPFLNRPSSKNS